MLDNKVTFWVVTVIAIMLTYTVGILLGRAIVQGMFTLFAA